MPLSVRRRRPPVLSVAAALTVVMVAGCAAGTTTGGASGASTAFPRGPENRTPPNEVVALPVAPGAIEKAVAAVDPMATELMKRSGIPGMAVAVVHDGKVLFSKGYGVRKVGSPEPVDENTVFQLASVSKPLGATVVAAAAASGKVNWTDPARRYLKGFALSDPYVTRVVTIGDLYAHHTGLPDHAMDNLEDLGGTTDEVLRSLRYLPLNPFRASYAYTNFGLTAGGEAVAAAMGKDWATLSDELLYRPLGMTSTSSRFADFEARSNRAVGHVPEGDTFVAKYVRDADNQSPAGGASSSVADMATWMMLRLDEGRYQGTQIADPEALLWTTQPIALISATSTSTARPGFYGYGMDLGTDSTARARWSHSGAFYLGAATAVTMLPNENLGIITLTNTRPQGVPETLNAMFMDQVEFGTQTRDWYPAYKALLTSTLSPKGELVGKQPPTDPAPPLALSAYAGSYVNDAYGPATVSVDGGTLRLTVGPRKEFVPAHALGRQHVRVGAPG